MRIFKQKSEYWRIKFVVAFFICITLTCNNFLSASGLITKKISSNDGLSNSAISVIHKDSSGVMWFGTWDGLNSFNGKNIRIFKSDKKNPKTITSNVIIDIDEPRKGILWISTNNGVNRLNSETREVKRFFETEGKNASTSTKSYKLALGPQNIVLCYSLKNTLNYFDEKRKEFVPLRIDILKSKKVIEILSDSYGTVFFVTGEMELFRLQLRIQNNKPEVVSCLRVQNQLSVRNIYPKSDNEFWLIDNDMKYIYLYNSTNGLLKIVSDITNLPSKGGIQTISEFNNEIMVGLATTGLFYFDILQQKWVQMQNPEYRGGVLSSFYDKVQQILWVGTNNNGVISCYREQLSFKCLANSDLSPRHASAVRAICEDSYNRIWIGNRGNGLSIVVNTPNVNPKIINVNEFTNKSILSLSNGPDGQMFVGTESEGLLVINTKT